MPADYALIIKTRAGVPKHILTGQEGGFRELWYRKEVNGVGLLMFDLDADHEAIANLEQDGQVEAWRWDTANTIDEYADFETLYVGKVLSADDDGNELFRGLCPGQMDFLTREIVDWTDGVASRSLFSGAKAETILKTLATYNVVTASATTGNGRNRTTDIANITVAADGAGGNTITFECALQPLLEAMQSVARIGDRDFYLTRTGAQAWQFRTAQYLGTDRSTTVTFALNFGNMSNPVLRDNRLNEKTVASVGGPGQGVGRTFVARTGTNYAATYNSKVVFVPATEYDDTDGLNAAGDIRLDELEAKDELTWDIRQTPGSLYGKHYFLGDLVTGYFRGVSATKQITAVEVSYVPGSDRAETIRIETGNV